MNKNLFDVVRPNHELGPWGPIFRILIATCFIMYLLMLQKYILWHVFLLMLISKFSFNINRVTNEAIRK